MSSPIQKAIDRAKSCQAAGTKFVTSVSLDPAFAVTVLLVAENERRDFSNLVEVALAEHAKTHGEPAPELAEVFAKLQAAHAAHVANPAVVPPVLPAVERAIRTTRRSKQKAAA